MIKKITLRGVASGIRRHPGRAAAVCVPVLAVSVFTGTAVASAHPEPMLALSRAQLHAAPGADVDTTFADGLSRQVVKAGKYAARLKARMGDDGCDHDYGPGDVCVPWQIPAPKGQYCTWLMSHGYTPLRVYGRDRLHLDTNHDGIACDAGDAGVR